MTIGENPLISIRHTDDLLLSMEKGGTFKVNQLTNSGYKMTNEFQLEHSGYCGFDFNTLDNVLITPRDDNGISVFSLDTLIEKTKLSVPLEDHTGLVSSIKYLNVNEQAYVLAGYSSGILKLWDLRTNKVLVSEQFSECITSIGNCNLFKLSNVSY